MPRKATTHRQCEAWGCENALPPGSRADRKFCSDTCARRVSRARARARQRRENGEEPTRTDLLLQEMGLAHYQTDGETTSPANVTTEAQEKRAFKSRTPQEVLAAKIPPTVGGEGFQRFAHSTLPDLILTGTITQKEAALRSSVSEGTLTTWMDLYNSVKNQSIAADHWQNSDEAQALRDYALSSFANFTEVFFPDDLVPDFHEEWDGEITNALEEGERTLLLAPQRHGKTGFNIRQCLYNIARNPNIQIMWVGKTQDLARKAVAVVRQYLENDPHFASVLLPPDSSFRPPSRRGIPWTNDEFTVATRTTIKKSPTMVALGIGGSILGRDADLIFIDDPVDRKDCLSPAKRTKINDWFFTDFNSRIEEHTGVVCLGSRQHKEDIYSEIIKKNAERVAAGNEPDWNVLVYRAHDRKCVNDLQNHPEDDSCILWPELRSLDWLAEQQRANREHFERNYLNNPSSDAFKPVTDDDIQWSYFYDEWLSADTASPLVDSMATDRTPRVAGMPLPGTYLVASVDPAVAKRNAAVLWCYSTIPVGMPADPGDPDSKMIPNTVRAVVDIAEPDPGSPGIVDILDEWKSTYNVTDWVFETNYYADQIANDATINDFKSRNGLRFHTHYTSKHNKHDSRAGVLAMLSSMQNRPTGLLLPGGSQASLEKIGPLVRQMLNYDPEAMARAGSQYGYDDLVMAAWFGWYWIEGRIKKRSNDIVFQYGSGFTDYSPSRWSQPPWSA